MCGRGVCSGGISSRTICAERNSGAKKLESGMSGMQEQSLQRRAMTYNEDCLEGMKKISDGTTDCSFDKRISFAPMWEQFLRPLRKLTRW